MKALLIFLGFLATISIMSDTSHDVTRTIPAPTTKPFPTPAPTLWQKSRLEVSGPLGNKMTEKVRSVR